jgi:hypothetical protein
VEREQRGESYCTPTRHPKQTCLFCHHQAVGLPVFSIGAGRLGICLDCARKAVAALERHQQKNA